MKPTNVAKKLKRRQDSYDNTVKNGRGKWSNGYKKPGSLNQHKS